MAERVSILGVDELSVKQQNYLTCPVVALSVGNGVAWHLRVVEYIRLKHISVILKRILFYDMYFNMLFSHFPVSD